MSIVTLRTPWTRQPSFSAEVNSANPLTKNLQVCFLANQPELMRKGNLTKIGFGTITVNTKGVTVNSVYNGAGANEFTLPVYISASGDRTFAVYAANVSDLGVNGNGIVTHTYNDADSTDRLYVGNTEFYAGIDNNDAPLITIQESPYPRLFGGRRRGNQVSAFVNETFSTESITGQRELTASSLRIGRDGATNSVDCQTYALYVWSRYVSNDEIVSLARDPWQMVAPATRRIYFPPPPPVYGPPLRVLTTGMNW